ncbi:MAG: OmpA family protein [Spirochaetes bacterium]|nr:OmpA family protein [Spirochaetota bacterium]
MQKIFYSIILLFFLPSLLLPETKTLENEFLKVMTDTGTGRFIIKTTGGDPNLPSSKNVLLLYESDPPNSFTTIRIDNEDFVFGDEPGKCVKRLNITAGDMNCVWQIKNILITQTIRFVKGPATGKENTVEISYLIKNKDLKPHTVGIRIMLDTFLGEQDGAPFRIPDVGPVINESEYKDPNIPQYWYVYDDLIRPRIQAQGLLLNEGWQSPDKVILASCIRFMRRLWDFDVDEKRTFRRTPSDSSDSAIAIYWKGKKLGNEEEYKVETYFGLYDSTVVEGNLFNVSVSGPSRVSDEPFLVNTDVQNKTPYKTDDITAVIVLPDELKLQEGEEEEKNVGALLPREINRISWQVIPQKRDKDVPSTNELVYKVKIRGKLDEEDIKTKATVPVTIKEREEEVVPQRKILMVKKEEPKKKEEKPDSETEPVKQIPSDVIIKFDEINFNEKEGTLNEKAKENLDEIGSIISNYNIQNLTINGYSDETKSGKKDLKLAEKRAEKVSSYLINKKYVDPDKVFYNGVIRESQPGENKTIEVKRKGSNVKIIIVGSLKQLLTMQGKNKLLFRFSEDSLVLFNYNKSELHEKGKVVLKDLAQFIKSENIYQVEIRGYTDNVGSSKFNQRLSERRAHSVYEFFVDQEIDEKKMLYIGYGEINPIGDNRTEKGRSMNRRCEIMMKRKRQRAFSFKKS